MRVMLGVVLLAGACGGDDGANVPDAAPELDSRVCTSEPTATIFLNPDGGSYVPGPEDSATNTTSILPAPATFSATGLDATAWDTLVACVADKFAPFAVTVTDVDPGNAPHLEVLYVPAAEWTMTTLSNDVSAVSPFNCESFPAPILIYNLAYDDPTMMCEVSAQVLANSQGLDHAFHCPDLQSFLANCGDKSFVDEDVPCGEFEARACQCGGDTQNSYQHLGGVFGFACE